MRGGGKSRRKVRSVRRGKGWASRLRTSSTVEVHDEEWERREGERER